MSKKLFYLPCEKYKSRWTEYTSGEDGMFARQLREDGRPVELITVAPSKETFEIKSGVVLDTFKRAEWCFEQVKYLILAIQTGMLGSDDTIYIEDFWLPGMETIPYACTLKGVRPKVYALLHAQSCDEADFTFQMLPWIRHFEVGWASWLSGIFVSHEILRSKVIAANICGPEKVHATGMIMTRKVLTDRFYPGLVLAKGEEVPRRDRTVVFTSRLDPEKRPDLFLKLAKIYLRDCPWANFRVLSGRAISDEFKRQAEEAGVLCLENIGKAQYYAELCTASVLANTAVQDFVSYALLDALAYGCQPLAPDWLTFPSVMGYESAYLYLNQNMEDAARKLNVLLARTAPVYCKGDPVPELYQKFGQWYEGSVSRMLDVMFGRSVPVTLTSGQGLP